MAHDQPDVPELIDTVREFLDGISAKLDGQDRYHEHDRELESLGHGL